MTRDIGPQPLNPPLALDREEPKHDIVRRRIRFKSEELPRVRLEERIRPDLPVRADAPQHPVPDHDRAVGQRSNLHEARETRRQPERWIIQRHRRNRRYRTINPHPLHLGNRLRTIANDHRHHQLRPGSRRRLNRRRQARNRHKPIRPEPHQRLTIETERPNLITVDNPQPIRTEHDRPVHQQLARATREREITLRRRLEQRPIRPRRWTDQCMRADIEHHRRHQPNRNRDPDAEPIPNPHDRRIVAARRTARAREPRDNGREPFVDG